MPYYLPLEQESSRFDFSMVPIELVKIGDRLRDVDPDFVARLAPIIDEQGILTPLVLNSDYTVIDGVQRLAAAKQLGFKDVPCILQVRGEASAALVEVVLNVVRLDLTELKLARGLRRAQEVYEQEHPEAGQGGAPGLVGGGKSKVARVASFAVWMAERMGVSDRSVRLKTQIGRELADEVDAVVSGSPVADSQEALLDIASAGRPADQVARARELVAAGGRRRSRKGSGEPRSRSRTRTARSAAERISADEGDRTDMACEPAGAPPPGPSVSDVPLPDPVAPAREILERLAAALEDVRYLMTLFAEHPDAEPDHPLVVDKERYSKLLEQMHGHASLRRRGKASRQPRSKGKRR